MSVNCDMEFMNEGVQAHSLEASTLSYRVSMVVTYSNRLQFHPWPAIWRMLTCDCGMLMAVDQFSKLSVEVQSGIRYCTIPNRNPNIGGLEKALSPFEHLLPSRLKLTSIIEYNGTYILITSVTPSHLHCSYRR